MSIFVIKSSQVMHEQFTFELIIEKLTEQKFYRQSY